MLARYEDIREAIAASPQWFDENGVPRYRPFDPELCPDIYADEVVLLEIGCQGCPARFQVEMHWDRHEWILARGAAVGPRPAFPARIREWQELVKAGKEGWLPLHYGDPPIHDCVGDTMNCIDLRILQFWRRGSVEEGLRWIRCLEWEVPLEPVPVL